ncbi:Eukaryotic protein of unknown function D [Prunus dulcis]|uniref:Solute carrier family 35 member F1 n=1 Tax=Prunus dulcis TaxID=3755 RepID=A0A4Y1QNZ3_PRUDU|nr:Eukaryotic protein of unknown function D [Prunus dulcis]
MGINAPTSQSFLNYVLLAIVYGATMLYRRKPLKAKWYYYVLLGMVDVEANFLVVKAYQYTSITSVMLLDCWSIPSVMLLTWVFLKTKYRFRKITGVVVCVAGLVMVVFSDVHAGDRAGGSNPRLGDVLVIAGSTLYAVSNVSEEFLVKNADRVELMAMLGFFGAIVSAIQISILERNELKSIHWSAGATNGSTMLNLSLLTSDMGDKEEDQQCADVADEGAERSKHFDEEAASVSRGTTVTGSSKTGDSSKHEIVPASSTEGEVSDNKSIGKDVQGRKS